MQQLIDAIETNQMKPNVPEFRAGDTVVVNVKFSEGNRERIQAFEGVVIAKRNRGMNSAFTVRKISYGEGVERVFQTHSPMIESIVVKRCGDVRKAKLYYLRERSGKSARIREKILTKKEREALKAAQQQASASQNQDKPQSTDDVADQTSVSDQTDQATTQSESSETAAK